MKDRWTRLSFVIALLAGLAGALDYTVRTSTATWTESFIFQWAVYWSPAIYMALGTVLLLKFRGLPQILSRRTLNFAAGALCLFSILVVLQILTQGRRVGSATYSEVLPLFVSGVPIAVLSFVVFFRAHRGVIESTVFAVVPILWIIMPIGIDTMYLLQGGYRGPSSIRTFAVLGTTYDFITLIAALALFVTPFGLLAALVGGIYFTVRRAGPERLHTAAIALSLFALFAQFINWGVFVWD